VRRIHRLLVLQLLEIELMWQLLLLLQKMLLLLMLLKLLLLLPLPEFFALSLLCCEAFALTLFSQSLASTKPLKHHSRFLTTIQLQPCSNSHASSCPLQNLCHHPVSCLWSPLQNFLNFLLPRFEGSSIVSLYQLQRVCLLLLLLPLL